MELMDFAPHHSSSDNLSVESLRHRLADIPLVHRPATADTDSSGAAGNIKASRSCYSCLCVRNGEKLDKYSFALRDRPKTTIIPNYRQFLRKVEDDEKSRSDESESSSRMSIPPDVWMIGGSLGSRNAVLVFRAAALASSSLEAVHSKPAYKLHITYKVSQAETKLLAKILDCHGVSEVPLESDDFNLMWTGNHPKPGVFRALCAHQRINHFPRSYELTRKDRLYKNIERMQHAKGLRNFDFIPQTFIMPNDFKELCSVHYRLRGPWIVKPVASSRGRGIFIVETPYQVPLDEPVVVAKYITNPLLVNGHKCDLRLYIVVTSYDPLLIYIYEEGLVRFATVKYDTSQKQLWNPCMHLCNYSINKYHSDYVKSDDPCAENVGHKWTLSALLRYLKDQGKNTIQLMSQIEDIVVKAVLSSANSIISACQMFVPNQGNCFELFGFDILIDADLKPWLLEVNLSPSLGCETPLDVRLKSAMLSDLLTLVGMPAVDPILKPCNLNRNANSSLIKMKLSTCRRVHSADGLSQAPKKMSPVCHGGRFSGSAMCLTAEETRIVKYARAQFQRRGGWVRVFPTVDSWCKYSQYLDPHSGIPSSMLPNKTTTSYMVLQHNYNQLLHTQLFPNVPLKFSVRGTHKEKERAMNASTSKANAGKRQDRYERQLSRGHKFRLDPTNLVESSTQPDVLKKQIVAMIRDGKVLSQSEARRTFSQYLGHILRRITNNPDPDQEAHIEIVLKFLQKASSYLRTPFSLKVPSSDTSIKDKAALAAKQLNDFIYLYNRETELFSDNSNTTPKVNAIPNKLFTQFLDNARERDLEEMLTLQTFRNWPNKVHINCGFQGLLQCFPSVTHCPKPGVNRQNVKKNGLKVVKAKAKTKPS